MYASSLFTMKRKTCPDGTGSRTHLTKINKVLSLCSWPSWQSSLKFHDIGKDSQAPRSVRSLCTSVDEKYTRSCRSSTSAQAVIVLILLGSILPMFFCTPLNSWMFSSMMVPVRGVSQFIRHKSFVHFTRKNTILCNVGISSPHSLLG